MSGTPCAPSATERSPRPIRAHPMGRSLAPIGAAAEGARIGSDAGLPFESNGVRYTVEHREGRLFHKGTWRDGDGSVLAEVEAEVRYALGSGTRGVAFLIEREGSLFQSPIAWFAHSRRWDISPGYREFTTHPSFERSIQPGCLACHANQFRPVPGTLNRYEVPIFQGHAIGCERCHGPGALHVNRSDQSSEIDLTIVNPAKLTPALRDSVCQQCHLQSSFRFTRAGRGPLDFRPGLPIHRFLAFYQMKTENRNKFEAVGHVEQMESSRCFRASQGRLGCISCHDPHRLPAPSTKTAYYRERCLACHEQRGCVLPAAERRAQGQGEDCVACHMPRLAITNIPHTAATNHGIPRGGVPGFVAEGPRDGPGQPMEIPLRDYHWALMSEDERRDSARDLGVAVGWAARTMNAPQLARVAATQALPLLEAAVHDRPDDLAACESLGHAYRFLDRPEDALHAFEEVLRIEAGQRVDPPLHRPPAGRPSTAGARALGLPKGDRGRSLALGLLCGVGSGLLRLRRLVRSRRGLPSGDPDQPGTVRGTLATDPELPAVSPARQGRRRVPDVAPPLPRQSRGLAALVPKPKAGRASGRGFLHIHARLEWNGCLIGLASQPVLFECLGITVLLSTP